MNYTDYYSPFDEIETSTKAFVQLDEGYYILELVDVDMKTTKAQQPVLIAKLKPQARIIQNNGSQILEPPNHQKPIDANFWLFSLPKDERNQKLHGIGFQRNSAAGANLSALFQIFSGYSLNEMKVRYSPQELEKQGIAMIAPIYSPHGTPDRPLIENADMITAQWTEFLNEFVVEKNTDPDVRNHKLVKCYLKITTTMGKDKNGETREFTNPEPGFSGTYLPLYIPLSTRERELYQAFMNKLPSPQNHDDFVGPDGTPIF